MNKRQLAPNVATQFPDLFPRLGTYRRPSPKVGRNEPCPCGSGLKYKKCCIDKEPEPAITKVEESEIVVQEG